MTDFSRITAGDLVSRHASRAREKDEADTTSTEYRSAALIALEHKDIAEANVFARLAISAATIEQAEYVAFALRDISAAIQEGNS